MDAEELGHFEPPAGPEKTDRETRVGSKRGSEVVSPELATF